VDKTKILPISSSDEQNAMLIDCVPDSWYKFPHLICSVGQGYATTEIVYTAGFKKTLNCARLIQSKKFLIVIKSKLQHLYGPLT